MMNIGKKNLAEICSTMQQQSTCINIEFKDTEENSSLKFEPDKQFMNVSATINQDSIKPITCLEHICGT